MVSKASVCAPIIIIGAGRSGTNILRDTLCSVNGLETWPCDEINYIWRHGNIKEKTDEFTREHARPSVKKYIQKSFKKLTQKSNASTIVEKTCANSLRVSFVDDVFPDARFIHIVRDGREVVNSARKRWRAEIDLMYVLKKARFIPLSDIPYYGTRYLGNRFHKLFSKNNQLATWGPRFKGIDEATQNRSLEEVCALQWRKCVEKASDELSNINSNKVYRISYESFVLNTNDELKKILGFLNVDRSHLNIEELSERVYSDSLGMWEKQMTSLEIMRINQIIDPVLEKLGYK